MTAVAPIEPNAADELVTFTAADGWVLSGIFRPSDPECADTGAAVVLVPAPHHERDAYVYGHALPDVLAARGIPSIRFDLRGRGASRAPRPWTSLTVIERQSVALDVAGAAAVLRAKASVSPHGLGAVAEQDIVGAALEAIEADADFGAVVLISPRFGRSGNKPNARTDVPVCALVSPEDRRSLRDAVAAYLAAPASQSVLHVLPGLGLGTTMFMSRAFEQPEETPLELMIADWLFDVLTSRITSG